MNLKPLVWAIIFAICGTLIVGVGHAVAHQGGASNAGVPLSANGSTYHYYHNDHQGRPVKLTNNVGAVTWSGQYSAYGISSITAQGAVNNIRAPGQYADSETGLYNNFQRNYDPALGSYLEEDPYRTRGGANRYNYGEGSPLRLYDPMGLVTEDDVLDYSYYLALGGLAVSKIPWFGPYGPAVGTGGAAVGTGIATAIYGRRCYERINDPCHSQQSYWECVKALLGAYFAGRAARAAANAANNAWPVAETLPELLDGSGDSDAPAPPEWGGRRRGMI